MLVLKEIRLNNCIAGNSKGISLLRAESCTGKTAFAKAIDTLSRNQISIDDATVMTYYLNRVTLRSASDFIL